MNAGKPWTPEEEERLMDALQRHCTISDIARRHNRSIRAIEMRIESLVRKHKTAGKTPEQLMAMFQKTKEEVASILSVATDRSIEQRLSAVETLLEKIYKKQKQILASIIKG